MFHLDDAVKSEYIIAHRAYQGDEKALGMLFNGSVEHPRLDNAIFWSKLFPWEKYRHLRELNVRTRRMLEQLGRVRSDLVGNKGIDDSVAAQLVDWLSYRAYNFEPDSVQLIGRLTIDEMVAFETQRRATMLILAIEAYRLEFGKPPDSLNDLKDRYFTNLPVDPFSGAPFVYFPQGISRPAIERNEDEFKQAWRNLVVEQPFKQSWAPRFNLPCVWCTSPNLVVNEWDASDKVVPASVAQDCPTDVFYYSLRTDRKPLPPYAAWGSGYMFPIPPGAAIEVR